MVDLCAKFFEDKLSLFGDNLAKDFFDPLFDMNGGVSIVKHGGQNLIFFNAIEDR